MSLEQEIKNLLKKNGTLCVGEYMRLCQQSYYSNASSLVENFITASEISQMFGEMIGAWLVSAWHRLKCPKPFALVELGAGTGVCMSDIWRVAKLSKDFCQNVEIHLVEISPALREKQRQTLSSIDVPIIWHKNCDNLPNMPSLFFANEMLDALPTQQWVKNKQGWQKRGVSLSKQGDFQFCVLKNEKNIPSIPSIPSILSMPSHHSQQPDGTIYEYSPARHCVIEKIANHLQQKTGTALFIDYGHWQTGFGDTLQAIKNHRQVDIFVSIGKSDITSHVDFQPLKKIAKQNGCSVCANLEQGKFLLSLGLKQRAEKLASNKTKQQADKIWRSFHRLTDDDKMGKLFKVLIFENIVL